jgi:hypothetical protein
LPDTIWQIAPHALYYVTKHFRNFGELLSDDELMHLLLALPHLKKTV